MLNSIRASIAALVVAASSASAQDASFGRTVLQRMHDAYAGRWYPTLTFVQKTTTWDSARAPHYETWYESVASHGGRVVLRIDRGAPSEGNGVLYTPDSAWVMREGTLAATRPVGNPFLPLIQGVYVQPVDQTVRELKATGVDLTRGYTRTVDGRRVSVVGAASAADSTSPQLWVDDERNVLVRMILSFAPGRPPTDVQLGGYEKTGAGWLATKVTMLSNGVPQQVEEYSDWRVDRQLPAALFDISSWTRAPHWARP